MMSRPTRADEKHGYVVYIRWLDDDPLDRRTILDQIIKQSGVYDFLSEHDRPKIMDNVHSVTAWARTFAVLNELYRLIGFNFDVVDIHGRPRTVFLQLVRPLCHLQLDPRLTFNQSLHVTFHKLKTIPPAAKRPDYNPEIHDTQKIEPITEPLDLPHFYELYVATIETFEKAHIYNFRGRGLHPYASSAGADGAKMTTEKWPHHADRPRCPRATATKIYLELEPISDIPKAAFRGTIRLAGGLDFYASLGQAQHRELTDYSFPTLPN